MEPGALLPYEQCLVNGESLVLRHGDRTVVTLDLARWLAPADAADRYALLSAVAPVLDVGCGPGRIVEALQSRGLAASGIDIAATAVELARARGVDADRCDVFGPVPGEGRWATVLLLDGNIGIGGSPEVLLARVAQLLVPSGTVIVETHEDEDVDARLPVRFVRAGRAIGPTFRWALVGRRALERHAVDQGYDVRAAWTMRGRSFLVLRAPA